MARVPTPIPETVVRGVRRFFTGPVVEVLWRGLVLSAFVTILYVLLLMDPGILLSFVITAVLGVVFSGYLRGIAIDVWRRDFWVFKT